MSENVMLLLIGGRSAVPAIGGALQFLDEINRVKFLLCNGEQYLGFQKDVENVLKQEREDLLCDEIDVKSVDPNKFDDVYTAVDELCKNVKDLKYVNLTTVPQTMAIAVYSYVREKYTDALIFSVNTNRSEIIPLFFGKEPIYFNKQLSVENYIAMCGMKVHKKKSGENSFLEPLARYFVEWIKTSSKVLYVIRSKCGENIKAPKSFDIPKQEFTKLGVLQNNLETLFKSLEEYELIRNFNISDKQVSFRIETKENYNFFGTGDWLELFVYDSARHCGFDSVEMGVNINNYRGEIDVFCLKSGNAMICECKTGTFSSNDLTILDSKAEKLGGKYCVKLFITSEQEVSEEFRNKAKNNRVVVVLGNELNGISEILKKEMQNPTYPRT